ncbi:hypothetical protein ABZ876_36760 [Streptomyces sp. NPDC046931]|uniref:hypothetical protein n=1 Tax=Streptomyces sp. NPDC046931 TaxID=3154806 RepID=UPI00340792DF
MINKRMDCTAYLDRFRTSRSIAAVLPPSADTEKYGRQIATALLLSLEAADTAEPVGLARPALHIAAFLDPAGHPGALWATEAVLDHLGGCDPSTAHDALRVLHRYALLTCEAASVRIHALTARAVREATSLGPRGAVI